jgi:hypothetical protein
VTKRIIQVSDELWNIRGSFKVGPLDVGTHASLVRRANGKFVFLDAYTLDDEAAKRVRDRTRGGQDVEAILNLHPFHTIHVRRMHAQFPDAKLYGTARHIRKFPELPWEALRTEDEELHGLFADDFDFEVPRGVDFISSNESVHFSSVLAFHRASKTIHVDDTLTYIRLPKLARVVGLSDLLVFHPTLSKALEKRAGAAREFREWADALAGRWHQAENLCAAHSSWLLAAKNPGASIPERIRKALSKAERTLAAHERKYG